MVWQSSFFSFTVIKMVMRKNSEILTHVGKGTPMGGLMRKYWLPAAKSSELVADGDPLRLMLLGEKLIAFRDSSGRVGIMDHRCPHRCASLFFGRNEDNGIRCVYHGWKFDTDGNCLEMPNVPAHQSFKRKVKARAYQTRERNGLIWVFLGDQNEVPDLPCIEPTLLIEDEVRYIFAQRECNWLQALEGDIDTSHFSWLHAGSVDLDHVSSGHPGKYQLIDRAPNLNVLDTDWGTMYGAYRETDNPDELYWRIAQFLFPFWTMPPDGDFKEHIIARAWVPMDDEHTMFVHISWKKNAQGLRVDKEGNPLPGIKLGLDYMENDTSWYGRWRLAANKSNDYRIDREIQRNNSFTGITGIHLQDQAITESMGSITDHKYEHFSPSDQMIARTRRVLLKAAKQIQKTGDKPPGLDNPDSFLKARAGDFLSDRKLRLEEAYTEQIKLASDPTGFLNGTERMA